MTDLEAALAPVRAFHYDEEVSPRSVLMAHIRAQGAWATKKTVSAAEAWLAQGYSFAKSARMAIGHPASPRRASVERKADSSAESSAAARRGDTAATHALPSLSQSAKVVHRGEVTPPPSDFGTLQWFPKRNSMGDLNGSGAVKLLGTPNVPLSTVLVRETAQNSWDARLGHAPVSYSVNLRTLSGDEIATLDSLIFPGEATGLGLKDALRATEVRVLEISDRGTMGLSGPIRSDLEIPEGGPRNFVDLVFNIGAPRDVHLGAGTYGFGKTIAYRTSRVGTVLFWSRSIEGDVIEDRLIGSAFGPSFTRGGYQYTGRHWWGSLVDDGQRVEPWVGHRAAEMAHSVFEARFADNQTGTSLMIIDPDLGGADAAEDVKRLADAIVWNLWPKLLPTSLGIQPMRIELLHEGQAVALPSLDDHPVLCGFAEALQITRAAQNKQTYSPKFDTRVIEIWSQRPKALLGHLAVTRFPRQLMTEGPPSETESVHSPAAHIAWMRHDAELIVRYDERQRLETDFLQWAAVFKPTATFDDSFAAAEPPAHDDWIPESLSDRRMASHVRIAIRRTREQVAELLRPAAPTSSSDEGRASVAELADSLAKLIGGVPGSRPRKVGASPSRSGSKSKRPSARLYRKELGQAHNGRRRVGFLIGVESAAEPVTIRASYGAATEAAPIKDEDLVRLVGWSREGDADIKPTDFMEVSPGMKYWFYLDAEADMAVSANFTVGA
ncbi:hypothetical protein [Tessaracoccus oleiagri]|uniref:Uncharacterized protein n=1 Tax=Tessaracoccus oleiagri TaxID=686624 RepID=A0A1G9I0D6_9ACTN|nr:hypothetical protein [Tessaracoccus oleiagri]SDL18516.1 hypothetical protein SAMN04488242_0637 [Tessaracoccus oleiagri]